jgi:uncharacterized repeat protein (TIGR01451 family)
MPPGPRHPTTKERRTMKGVRAFWRSCALAAVLLLASQSALGQAGPILGSAPVRTTPSVATPLVGDSFTIDVAIDLAETFGTTPSGSGPAAVTAFRVPLTFDSARLELTAVGAGADPSFAAAGFDATSVASANASGQLLIAAAQTGLAPQGLVSIATLTFRAKSAGAATIAADTSAVSLASAIQTSAATLFGPAAIPPRAVGGGVVVQTPPGLAVTLEAGPSPVTPDGQILYVVRCQSSGGSPAKNVIIRATLPQGATFSGASGGGVFQNGIVEWAAGDLAPAGAFDATFTANVTAAAGTTITTPPAVAQASNVAAVSSGSPAVSVSASAPMKPGMVMAASSYGENVGTIYEVSSGTAVEFARIPSNGWVGALLFTATGRLFAATDYAGGSLFDISAGGNLTGATPFVRGLGEYITGLTRDPAGNFYVSSLLPNARIRKISPNGAVTQLERTFNLPGDVFVWGNTLYVSEGATGTVWSLNLTSGVATPLVTGFTPGSSHFSGQFTRNSEGRLYVLWRSTRGSGLFDITSGGVFTNAFPVTAQNAFRLDVNEVAIDSRNNIYFAGNGSGKVWRSQYLGSPYAAATVLADGVSDNEAIAVYPLPNVPLLAVSTSATPTPAVSGRQVVYTITAENRGGAAAANAMLTVALPPGVTFVSASSGGTVAGDIVSWSIGSFAAGTTISRTVTVAVTAGNGATLTGTPVTISATSVFPVEATLPSLPVVTPPALHLSVSAPASVPAGAHITYTLTYRNTGGSASTQTIIEQPVPAGTTFAASELGTRASSTAPVRWTLGSVNAGVTGTVTFVVLAGPTAGATITNTGAQISADLVNPVTAAPVTTTTTAASPLAVTVVPAPNPVVPGTQINTRVTYRNSGTTTQTNVTISVPLPQPSEFLSATGGGVFDGSKVTWTIPTLAPSAQGTVRVSFRTRASGNSGMTIAGVSASNEAAPAQRAPVIVKVMPYPADIQAGVVLSGNSYQGGLSTGRVTALMSPTVRTTFADTNDQGWLGPLWIATDGHVYAATNAANGALYDITAGGNLESATPIATELGIWPGTLASDIAGNLYITTDVADARIRRITPEGDVSVFGPPLRSGGGITVDDEAGVLYVSEGMTGSVHRVDLASGASTVFATGFPPREDHFSGQLVRTRQGRLLLWWGWFEDNLGLFDITAGGNFSSAAPITGKNAFRLDVNQMAIGPNDDIYIAGNGSGDMFRAPFIPATQSYGPTTSWARNLADNESVAVFPAYRLTIAGTASVSQLNRGEPVTFTFTGTNASTAQVENVVMDVPLPAGFTLDTASSGATVTPAAVRWLIGTLVPGASETVSISGHVHAREGSTVTMTGYTIAGDARATATGPALNVIVNQQLAVQVRATPEPVASGQTITYKLRYENLNAAAATNVVVRSEIPIGTTFLTATNGATRNGRELQWTVANVAGGSTGEVTFTARADVPPSVTLADYEVISTQFGSRTGVPVTTTVLPLPVNLSISAAASTDPVVAGTQLNYLIHYANDGGSPASGATLRAEIPPSTRFMSAEGGGTLAGSQVVWQLGTVASLNAGDVAYSVVVEENATGSILNDAISLVTAQQQVNAAPITTRIVAPPPPQPLGITLAAEPSPVDTGALLTYRIEVTNPDAAVATNVIVLSDIPAGTSLISTTGPATADGSMIQWSLGDLQPGDTIALGIVVRAPSSAGTITHEGMTATATGRDTARSNSVETEVVEPAARLHLSIEGPESVLEGGTITYVLHYRNDGHAWASGATVDMPIPAGTSLVSTSPAATVTNGIARWSAGSLAAGATGSVDATVRVAVPAGSTIANSGSQMRAANAPAAVAETLLTDVVVPPAVFTATLTTDKPHYVAPETVQQRATITYASGGSGAAGGLTALLETINATGSVLASHSGTLPLLSTGGSAPLAFNWSTNGVSSGTYEVTLTVTDAAGAEIIRMTAPFTVSAPDGAKLSGTIAPTNSPLPVGLTLRASIEVRNDSGFDYLPLPLEIALVDPSTLAVVVSSPVSNVDIAANGTVTREVTLPTSGLSLGTYELWLTTSVGAGRRLDTDEVQIIAPLLTISPAAQSIVAGSTGELTATLSAPAAEAIELALTSSNSSVVIAPASITIPAGAASQSVAVEGRGAGGPVTITATLPQSLGGASATATVTVLLNGQLTATAEVFKGEDVAFEVSIVNSGATALAESAFAIELRSTESETVIDTISFSASIAPQSTFTRQFHYTTSSLTAQSYTARLVWSGIAPPHAVGTAPFVVVEAPPLRVDSSVGTKPRVVIWTNCSPGNSNRPCTPVKPPFLTATLDAAGIPYVVAGEQDEFLRLVRTGTFSVAIIDEAGENEAKIATEFVADVHAGIGLFFIYSAPNAMPKMSPALGTTFGGKLLGPTTIQLRATPFTSAGTLTLHGDGVKLSVSGAQTVATVGTSDAPAIVHHDYGTGRSVTVPFDLERSPTPAVAQLIVDVVRYVARTTVAPFTARDVVPLRLDVTTPPGNDVPVTVALNLPAGVAIVAATPPLTSDTPARWSVSLPGNTTTGFDVWLRLPDGVGASSITITAALTGGPPLTTTTIDLLTSADAATLRTKLHTELTALRAAARTNQDVKALDDALAQLTEISGPTDALLNVTRVLKVIANLEGLSTTLNSAAARTAADRLFLYWQSRTGASA